MVQFKKTFLSFSFLLLGQYLGVIALGELPNSSTKPSVYTYITIKGNENVADIMSKDVQLKLWSEAWIEAGFNTMVLTPKDVNQHPRYKEILARLSAAKVDEKRFGRYLRYLAMSQVGGWYSDTVILPFGLNGGGDLPNNGKFVIHQANAVAELMSGSKSEWERMVNKMIENPNNDDNDLLKYLLKKDPRLAIIEDSVTSSVHLIKTTDVDVCVLAASDKVTAAKFQSRIAVNAGIPRRNYYDAVQSSLESIYKRCNIEKPDRRSFTIEEQPSDNTNNDNGISSIMQDPAKNAQLIQAIHALKLAGYDDNAIMDMLRSKNLIPNDQNQSVSVSTPESNNLNEPVNSSTRQFPSGTGVENQVNPNIQQPPSNNQNDVLNMLGLSSNNENSQKNPTVQLSANQDNVLNMLRGSNVDNPVNPGAQELPSNNQNDLLSTLGLPSSNKNIPENPTQPLSSNQDSISNLLRGNNVDSPVNPSSQQLPSNNQNDILNMLGLSNNANAQDNTNVQQAPSNNQNDILKMLGVLPNAASQPQTRQLPAINQNGASDLLGRLSNNANLPNNINTMQLPTNNQNNVSNMLGLSTNNN